MSSKTKTKSSRYGCAKSAKPAHALVLAVEVSAGVKLDKPFE